ncbi:MAG: SMI1/KNR4 family protein, partial [Lachnospiraceae bacterium]|nr:SMI1/KNR4 family protein [Lachnospiraceae bacterium]
MVEFCEGTLDSMMERLCNSISSIDKGWIKRCVPATEEQIQQLQDIFAAYHYTIPSAYLQYLRVMGQNDRGLLQYGGDYDPDIDTVLDYLTDDNDVQKDFEKGFFMFSRHWADPAFYLNLSSIKDNPIVTDDDKNYIAGSFEKFLFQRVFEMYQKTFKHYATDNGDVCHEKKETEECRECLLGMTAEERMNFMIQFAESYGVKKTWFSDQVHFYCYDMNYALEINIHNGYRVRLYYNDDKVFELAHREFEKI